MSANDFAGWWPWIWPVIGIVGTVLHLIFSNRTRTGPRVLEVFLLWWFAWGVGVTAFAAFFANTFAADALATKIGFPLGNPFQFEVAMANLAVCVIGFLCLRYRGLFWSATTIVATVYLWGAALGHIVQAVVHGNYEPYNTGAILYTDIGVQLVLIAALIIYRRMLGVSLMTGHRSPVDADIGAVGNAAGR